MSFVFDNRQSESPLVEGLWRTQTEQGGSFVSSADRHWEMVITTQKDKTTLSVRGPGTSAKLAPIPENAEFFGIIFSLGTYMPKLPTQDLVDKEIHLPVNNRGLVHLFDDSWEVPNIENVDIFIHRLVKEGLLTSEPLVESVMQNEAQDVSLRTIQRRFLNATGMPYGVFDQIARAQKAQKLLEQGVPILDVVHEAGYSDQPHLTKSLKRFLGQTPGEIINS